MIRAAVGDVPPRVPNVSWTFLTNHALVLLAIAQNPQIRLREVAATVGITERAVQRIVSDLVEAGYVSRTRTGRRNAYELHGEVHLPHPITRHQEVGALMDVILRSKRRRRLAQST
jgi:DNA-binding Lrp family transcriptional regulator